MTIRLSSRSKFNAKKTTVDNITFASQAEAKRYAELKLLEKAGEISRLHLQPAFVLSVRPIEAAHVGSILVGKYIADFSYRTRDGEEVVEDVKGVKTAVYKLKKRIVEALYGIRISEVA